ncbi:uncharacterized protein DUF3291 [Rhizobium sp. SJZ105]|uniref:DUF3291 domain-containing protein n=1 Tax=Rhizobium sp. SJZ105 TaxID=2572678 RepID=UPI00119D1EAA|nr:DUF3291 domain-containing protein [Rhizobium sp. SJZ105]TWC76343.1 uncharacterized protein DUF3291 [Rhizobium sp. SJZ105]
MSQSNGSDRDAKANGTRRLAVVNFARTNHPLAAEEMRPFLILTQAVYRQADEAPGCLGVAHPVDRNEHLSFFERDWGRWGAFTAPEYYAGGVTIETVQEASALSCWIDLSSLYSFVYSGMHLRGLANRRNYFQEMEEPGYAMWWTLEQPTWEEGASRLEKLWRSGISPEAFTFKNPYDEFGAPLQLSDIRLDSRKTDGRK